MTRDLVLLLTHSGDFFVPERVAEALAARGVQAQRLNSDLYPAEASMQLGLSPDAQALGDTFGVPLERVRAVWARRIWPSRLPEDLDPRFRQGLIRECAAHWAALEDLLWDRTWVNPPEAERAVEGHKLRQLRLARAAGLPVPDTLVTNDPQAARAFCARHGDDVVVKMLTPLSVSMDGRGPHVRTQALGPEDLDALDQLSLSPMCFQPRIRAHHELRVAWVEGQHFVGEIGGEGGVDWRGTAQTGWRPGVLPEPSAAALTRLMRTLGLSFGSVDFIVPEDGVPIFLEVNPSGEWGMLEHSLDLPISAAIADALLRAPR